MAIPLIHITRGKIVESIHQGDIAITDSRGQILYSAGDPFKMTYFRSAAKPIQALNVLLSGAAEAFELTDAEIAVICSSHYAEPHHRETIEGILRKIGLKPESILGGIVPSLKYEYALQVAREGLELTPLFSDCSGKHAGFLAVCQHLGYSIVDYLGQNHPIQQEILNIMSTISAMKPEEMSVGIDGCSAPVHAMPIYNMAFAYASMVSKTDLPENYSQSAEKIFNAMNRHPEMISGTGGFCSDLIRCTNSKLIGKVGAEGVYCVGLKKEGIGIAVKVENGSMAVLPPIVMKVLNDLGVLSEDEKKDLDVYTNMKNLNDVQTEVGKFEAVFELVTQ